MGPRAGWTASRLPPGPPPRSEITPRPRRVLFLFLDGVGVGPGQPGRNPFVTAKLPTLRGLSGGALPVAEELAAGPVHGARSFLGGIDATLHVAGLPQSGTGQTALLTGINAAQRLGRHFGPWVPTALRPLLSEESLFRQAGRADVSVTVANAYPRAEIGSDAPPRRRPGAFPFAAAAANALDRDEAALRRGEALASSITTDAWRRHVDPEAPPTTPRAAGERLARIAAAHQLTVFAHYDTDYVGHRGGLAGAVTALERVDRFLAGLVDRLPNDTLLLVTSDHGNIEDAAAGHTRNPALLLAVGPGHVEAGQRIRSLTDVTPTILFLLGSRSDGTGESGAGPG